MFARKLVATAVLRAAGLCANALIAVAIFGCTVARGTMPCTVPAPPAVAAVASMAVGRRPAALLVSQRFRMLCGVVEGPLTEYRSVETLSTTGLCQPENARCDLVVPSQGVLADGVYAIGRPEQRPFLIFAQPSDSTVYFHEPTSSVHVYGGSPSRDGEPFKIVRLKSTRRVGVRAVRSPKEGCYTLDRDVRLELSKLYLTGTTLLLPVPDTGIAPNSPVLFPKPMRLPNACLPHAIYGLAIPNPGVSYRWKVFEVGSAQQVGAGFGPIPFIAALGTRRDSSGPAAWPPLELAASYDVVVEAIDTAGRASAPARISLQMAPTGDRHGYGLDSLFLLLLAAGLTIPFFVLAGWIRARPSSSNWAQR